MANALPVQPALINEKPDGHVDAPILDHINQKVHWDGRPKTENSLPIGRNELYRPYITARHINVDDRVEGQPAVLPAGVSAKAFTAYLESLRTIVGADAVETGAKHAARNVDPFAITEDPPICSASVYPTTVEQIQALVKAANAHEPAIPFWTVGRGRNLGYGGSSPVVHGSICMDLSRMKKIIEVNEEYAYCIVEPGVTFFDLYDEIRARGLDLLSTTPGIGWGSVVGNTLDRGWGYTAAGDHPNQVAGMEVVLADGDLMRTNMGALDDGGKLFAHFKGSYGPGAEALFFQSNFGIVTKLALWLSPKPKAMYLVIVDVDKEDDLEPLVDICGMLTRKGLIDNRPVIGNLIRMATLDGSNRSRYWEGPEAIPDDVLEGMREKLDHGFWNSAFAIYGDPRILDIKLELIKEAFANVQNSRVRDLQFVGEEKDRFLLNLQELFDRFGIGVGINLGVPSLVAVDSCKWRGDDCGHLSFSPILRPNGKEALEYYKLSKVASAKYGFDFFAGLHLSGRHLCAIQMTLYDRHDPAQCKAAKDLFEDLLEIGGKLGVSEYRAHVEFMDNVAAQYAFNNNAQLRFNQRLKDALDPKGILSPGKQGIWNSEDSRKESKGRSRSTINNRNHTNGTHLNGSN